MSKFEAIKEEQMDILREVGNIGAGHSASAMAQVAEQKDRHGSAVCDFIDI